MQNEEQIWDLVDKKKDIFIELADRVFDTPETLYTEFDSVAEHIKALYDEGFSVTEGACGMPTAVTGDAGDAGDEGPLIAIMGESFAKNNQVAYKKKIKDHLHFVMDNW